MCQVSCLEGRAEDITISPTISFSRAHIVDKLNTLPTSIECLVSPRVRATLS